MKLAALILITYYSTDFYYGVKIGGLNPFLTSDFSSLRIYFISLLRSVLLYWVLKLENTGIDGSIID